MSLAPHKKSVRTKAAAADAMKQEFKEMRQQIHNTLNAGKGKGKGKGKCKGKVDVVMIAIPPHCLQLDAKRFIPPASSIWVNNKGGWCAHVPPSPRISERNAEHGTSQ